MSSLSSFIKAEEERRAELSNIHRQAVLEAEEELYQLQLEHELKMKKIKFDFLKNKLNELNIIKNELEKKIYELSITRTKRTKGDKDNEYLKDVADQLKGMD